MNAALPLPSTSTPAPPALLFPLPSTVVLDISTVSVSTPISASPAVFTLLKPVAAFWLKSSEMKLSVFLLVLQVATATPAVALWSKAELVALIASFEYNSTPSLALLLAST